MNWTDILGHADIIKRLRSIVADGSFPHAMIFAGVRGVGKYTIAELTAAALLCQSKENAPCGNCASCRALRAGNPPDLFKIAPDPSLKNPTIKIGQRRRRGVGSLPKVGRRYCGRERRRRPDKF